jgi:hypothetical protein
MPKITPQASAIKESKAIATVVKRSRSRKHGKNILTGAKENSGIRVRKVFIQNNSGNKTPILSINMSKSAQGKVGFNLLTTSKEFKGHAHQLAPVK